MEDRRNFWRENAVPLILAATTIVSSYAITDYRTSDAIRRVANLEKYTRDTKTMVRDNKENISVISTKVEQQERMAAESNQVLKGVQEALNKNTVAVELLSARLKVVKE